MNSNFSFCNQRFMGYICAQMVMLLQKYNKTLPDALPD